MNRKQFLQQSGLAAATIVLPNALFSAFVPNGTTMQNINWFKPTDAVYETLRKGFNKRIDNKPTIIAQCKNSQGVQEALQYAIKNNMKISVRSGGHCMEGFSCLPNTLQIHLGLMQNIQVANKKLIVQPAATLKQIYETVIPKGLYLPGGSCQSVGIAGLTLGGGYGLLSRQFGLTCDSLQQVTFINGKGELVTTQNNKELLWACRGGNNGNFGVVTELQFGLHTAPKTLQSFKFRDMKTTVEKALHFCSKWFELTQQLPKEAFSTFIYNGRTVYVLVTTTGKVSGVEKILQAFKALSNKTSQTVAQPLGRALKNYYAEANPISFKNASAGLYKGYDDIKNALPQVFNLLNSKPGIIFQLNTLGGKIKDAGFEEGSSFAYRDYNYFTELQAYFENDKINNKMMLLFANIQNTFKANGLTAQYRNYPDINFTQTDQLYYGKNLKRLQAVKQEQDPYQIFAGAQTIKPY
jgi:hypothetical protein